MTDAHVSILIPCYNAERYIAQAIESALGQDYPHLEVIVVDDGSTDGSANAIRRYESRANFRWESGPNRGGGAARNRLLAMARGQLVQFLDADDVLEPEKLWRMVPAMAHADMVFCDFIEHNENQHRVVQLGPPTEDLLECFIRAGVQTSIPLHRREHLLAVGGFDERLPCCQEYELHLRLARRSWRRVAHIPEPLCRIVKRAGSVSSDQAKVFSWKAKILTRLHDELLRSGELTPSRATALAQVLHTCGRHLARHGLTVEADHAFGLAKMISPDAPLPARFPMRALAGAIGPVRAERVRASVYRMLGRQL